MKVYVDGFLAGTRTISQSQMITIASSFNVGGSWLYGAFARGQVLLTKSA